MDRSFKPFEYDIYFIEVCNRDMLHKLTSNIVKIGENQKQKLGYAIFCKSKFISFQLALLNGGSYKKMQVAKGCLLCNVFDLIRGEKILEQLSRTRFFMGFENPALFFHAMQFSSGKRAGISNHVKKSSF